MDVRDDQDNAQRPVNPGASDASSTPPDAARRRLLKAGLSAAPIILTVRSRPAWAQANDYPSLAYGNTPNAATDTTGGATGTAIDAESVTLADNGWQVQSAQAQTGQAQSPSGQAQSPSGQAQVQSAATGQGGAVGACGPAGSPAAPTGSPQPSGGRAVTYGHPKYPSHRIVVWDADGPGTHPLMRRQKRWAHYIVPPGAQSTAAPGCTAVGSSQTNVGHVESHHRDLAGHLRWFHGWSKYGRS
jgi:hypothetical protein